MEKKDRLFISLYNDYYGSLLTEYQRQIVDGYYNLDMSLSELAEEHGISPQGVRDALKRAEKQLESFEEKLGIVKKSQSVIELLQDAIDNCGEEGRQNLKKAIDILKE